MHVDQPARILVIDDNPAIHEDFRKILCHRDDNAARVASIEKQVFGDAVRSPAVRRTYELETVHAGVEGLRRVEAERTRGQPFALCFVDVRMPEGWDGLSTCVRIRDADPDIQIVICTAYSDYSWTQITRAFGASDRLLVLKKPFEDVEVLQLASALTAKWRLQHERQSRLQELTDLVRFRSEALDRASARLANEIDQRQQAEVSLRHAQRLDALGLLTAGLAHEINNPLSYVVTNIEYARDEISRVGGERGAEVCEALSEALDGAHRIRDIIRDVKLFAGRNEGPSGAVDLPQLVEETLKTLGNEVRHRATLETTLVCTAPAHGDPRRLQQVLVNLLMNAVQALPEGNSGSNRIQISAHDASAESVILQVRDNGRGIPAENLERVFHPFFTTQTVGRGMGLGLPVCDGIVSSLGGRIEMDSEPGTGTVVRVFLPVADATAAAPGTGTVDADAGAASLRASANALPPSQGPARVLVIDDDPHTVRSLSRCLHTVELSGCSDARAALELLENEDYDLVVCDVMMPELSAVDLYHSAKQRRPGLQERFVFITGGAFTGRESAFLQNVSNPCLSKPFETDELRKVIDEQLARLRRDLDAVDVPE